MSRCRLGVSVEAVSSRSSCHHLEPEVHSKDFLKDFFFLLLSLFRYTLDLSWLFTPGPTAFTYQHVQQIFLTRYLHSDFLTESCIISCKIS